MGSKMLRRLRRQGYAVPVRQEQPRYPHSVIECYTTGIAARRRDLANIAIIFHEQWELLPLQCSAALERLSDLRQAAQECRLFLEQLEPDVIRKLRPWASIEKLSALDEQLTRVMLTIATFLPACQAICFERIELHLAIRSRFPYVLATFEDVVSQLAALPDAARPQREELQQCS